MEKIEDYFSLEDFEHRDLWKNGEPVWSPLLELSDYLKSWAFQIEIDIPSGVYLDHPEWISIGRGTLIEPGVFIRGPCVIGRECILRHGAYLRDGVICGNRAVIGHSAEVKHSILLNEAAASHFTYVGDSIIGSRANLGAGVKCSNLRLDRGEVSIFLGGNRIQTGLKKFGAIVGDRVQIGCNSVLNPGTLVGKESISHPLLNFGGKVAPRSKISGENKAVIEPLVQPLLELMERARVP